jgi:hypothetical protein
MLYFAFDVVDPFLPGAFSFNPDESVEVANLQQPQPEVARPAARQEPERGRERLDSSDLTAPLTLRPDRPGPPLVRLHRTPPHPTDPGRATDDH